MKRMRMMAALVAVALMAVTAVRADDVTNWVKQATAALPGGYVPALVRLHKTSASTLFDGPPGTFQIQSVTVANALVNNGTIIVNRVNGAMTNALVTVTASSGAASGTLVDAYGFPNAHLVYRNKSGKAYSNDDGDQILITGTCTNAIVELKGVMWY